MMQVPVWGLVVLDLPVDILPTILWEVVIVFVIQLLLHQLHHPRPHQPHHLQPSLRVQAHVYQRLALKMGVHLHLAHAHQDTAVIVIPQQHLQRHPQLQLQGENVIPPVQGVLIVRMGNVY